MFRGGSIDRATAVRLRINASWYYRKRRENKEMLENFYIDSSASRQILPFFRLLLSVLALGRNSFYYARNLRRVKIRTRAHMFLRKTFCSGARSASKAFTLRAPRGIPRSGESKLPLYQSCDLARLIDGGRERDGRNFIRTQKRVVRRRSQFSSIHLECIDFVLGARCAFSP